jgi:DNA modification methylase
MGSGTTAVAAIKSDRKFVGYEISPEYIQLAKKRVKPLMERTSLQFETTEK